MYLIKTAAICLSFILAGLSATTAQTGTTAFTIEQIGPSMAHPWGISFVDDESVLVTLRGGEMLRIELQTGKTLPLANIQQVFARTATMPEVFARKQGGLLDVLTHTEASGGPLSVYICYSKPVSGGAVTAIDRAELGQEGLVKRRTIFQANSVSARPVHFGCRMAIRGGYLYMSIGDRGQPDNAQDMTTHSGSIVRLHLDGRIPDDNPVFAKGAAPGLFTKGHRNPQGMAIHPQTGDIWISEHGPKGGDEINILTAGANYGWPLASFGKEYFGGSVGGGLTSFPGTQNPVWHWTPSIAPSGIAFYDKQMFPELRGGLLVASLKFRRLYHVGLAGNLPAGESVILDKRIGRVRDVEIAPDGSILLLSDEASGGLYRLSR